MLVVIDGETHFFVVFPMFFLLSDTCHHIAKEHTLKYAMRIDNDTDGVRGFKKYPRFLKKYNVFFGKNMANTIIFPVSKADFRLEASDIFTLFDPSLVTQ